MRLNSITGKVYYIDAAVNLGLITNENGDALLVDTGIDDSVARKAARLIQEGGFNLKGIIITHAHADHCGGAPHLAKTTGARVYAPEVEKSVLEFPLWEPAYLFSGVYPPPPMRNKFLLAPGVRVDETIAPGTVAAGGCMVEIVDLAGHSLNQVGVSADGVLFCADAVIGPEVIEKHGIPLNSHLAGAMAAYETLERRKESFFVPAHGTPVADIKPVVAANRGRVNETLACVLDLLKNPLAAEEILAGVCGRFGINITSMGQYYLMHHTVTAYLSHLMDKKEIEASYRNNRQTFLRVC
ncbi:MAG: MBL fold metallo-hydrolase [Peptococcaceae bacterium]|nr:MBL fold metallo-hydrolase [Peptococcaceae bacterium]